MCIGNEFPCQRKVERRLKRIFSEAYDAKYTKLQESVALPITVVALLKHCTEEKDSSKGRKIHDDIVKRGLLEKNLYVGNALINMYAKCGLLDKAQEVFNKLPAPDIVSWNTMIAGYTQQRNCEGALYWFEKMQQEGPCPNDVTYICMLKACASIRRSHKGREIHSKIVRGRWLEKNSVIGNALIDMYAKCGLLEKAQEVFDELFFQNVVSWTTLIAGYVQHGHNDQALNCFDQMQLKGFTPNDITFACILKACGALGAGERGQEIHAQIIREGHAVKDVVVGNALIDMYAKCGLLHKAQTVFNELQVRDVVSWTSLIAGNVQEGQTEEALNCFEQMQSEGISPDTVTLVCILKACGSLEEVSKGQEVHSKIVMDAHFQNDMLLGNALVGMYAKCGLLKPAQAVLEKLPVQDVASWNALIAGYSQHGYSDEALNCFEQMRVQGHYPSAATLASVLHLYGNLGASQKGEELHGEIEKDSCLMDDIIVGNALIAMYMKCGLLGKAQEIFNKLSVKNVVSWTALIAGYTSHGYSEEALSCFHQMQHEGISPNLMTMLCILKACAIAGTPNKGQEVHSSILRDGLFDKDVGVAHALIFMYANCNMLKEAQALFDKLPTLNTDSSKALITGYAKYGWLGKAQNVFDKLSSRDVDLWNALLIGYVQHQHNEEALKCYEVMQSEVSSLDTITYVCMLKACGNIGAMGKGQEIHVKLVKDGLEEETVIANALVDMYASFGMIIEAQKVFDELSARDIVTWTALVAAYAQMGNDEAVVKATEQMVEDGNVPDVVMFTVLLSMCSHSVLLDEAQMCFEIMMKHYGIIPTLEHYACLVDLFSRSGELSKAMILTQEMPYSANLSVWHTLLAGCRKRRDLDLGKVAFEHATQLDEEDGASYISMSNICATED